MKKLPIYSTLLLYFTILQAMAVPFDPNGKNVLNLNGPWKFHFLDAPDGTETKFMQSDFNEDSWDQLEVPGNWEMAGYELPHYGVHRSEVLGLYRKQFKLPDTWSEKYVWLHFEGVSFGFEVWVNEKKAGSFESAFQPFQVNITPFLNENSDNTIAVKVYKNHPETAFDCNDAWSLSGIYRDVYLVATNQFYIDDYTIQTSIEDAASASIKGEVVYRFIRNEQPPEITNLSLQTMLTDQEGNELYLQDTPVQWSNANFFPETSAFTIPVENPILWNAEDPYLYQLKLSLLKEGETIHSLTQDIGIREILIENGVFKINGQAVKLRGTCRHEIHPAVGRALREAHWVEDLRLMKQANINAIRTSHYPPHPRLLELCDQMGFYVVDEVPFGFGEELMDNPHFLGSLLARANNTIARDKNHPSIIAWSIGNENPVFENVQKVAKYVKLLDSTRPLLFPNNNFGSHGQHHESDMPAFTDIHAKHYPDAEAIIDYAEDESLNIPFLFTELNHSLDVAFGGFEEKWEIIESYDNLAGDMIWLWADQGLYRNINSTDTVNSYQDIGNLSFSDTDISLDFWHNEDTVIDSHGQFGTDGIVYGNRIPQEDYYEVMRVYSPVKILEESFPIQQDETTVTFTILNRYDFTNLSAVTINWYLKENNTIVDRGVLPISVAPHQKKEASIDLNIAGNIQENSNILFLEFIDPHGTNIYKHAVELIPVDGALNYATMLGQEMQRDPQQMTPTEFDLSTIENQYYKLQFNENGQFSLLSLQNNQEVLHGPLLRVGRKPTMAEQRMYGRQEDGYWLPYLLKDPKLISKDIIKADDHQTLFLNYEFSRKDDPTQIIEAELVIQTGNRESLNVSYQLTSTNCKGYFTELGLAFFTNKDFDQFSWLGDGPYQALPFKEELAIRDIYKLHKDSLYFNGNRQQVDLAMISNQEEHGIGIAGEKMNFSVENDQNQIIISHNLLVASPGTKFKMPRLVYKAENLGAQSGSFLLVPLSKDAWPDAFIRTFDK